MTDDQPARDESGIFGNWKDAFAARDVLFEYHLKFWNTASVGIPVRSLLYIRQTDF